MEYPFIYICSLMRTGSTLLQEALTKSVYSLILSEPRFDGKIFRLNPEMIKQIKDVGVSMQKEGPVVEIFKKLNKYVMQVGVKEIRNRGWQEYINEFGNNIRILLTGRDPRDVYISASGVFNRGKSWKPRYGFTPLGLFKELKKEIVVQKQIITLVPSMKIKYEDLCSGFDVKFNEIKKFVNSPIPDIGEIGEFHGSISAGQYEADLHRGKVTTRSICRWKNEQNQELLDDAYKFFDLMVEYNNFWGYN